MNFLFSLDVKKRFAGGEVVRSSLFIGATQKLFIGYLGDVYIFKFPATSFWEKWNVSWFVIILFYEHYHEAKVASCRYIFKENNSSIGYFAIHFPQKLIDYFKQALKTEWLFCF